MAALFNIILALHVTGGTVGLLSGTINIVRKKGDKKHKLTGKFFLYGMLLTGISSIILSLLHPNYFLFIVGIFTIYMTISGTRYLYLKDLSENKKNLLLDWILSGWMLLFGIAFLFFGFKLFIQHENFALVFILFGIISLRFVYTDWKNYSSQSKIKNFWLIAHIQRMTGAYIAAMTAFLVVNQFIPGFIVWIAPTIILTPLIFKWTRKYSVIQDELI